MKIEKNMAQVNERAMEQRLLGISFYINSQTPPESNVKGKVALKGKENTVRADVSRLADKRLTSYVTE